MLQTQVSMVKTLFWEVQSVFAGGENPQVLTCTAQWEFYSDNSPSSLMLFTSLILYIRKLGLRKLTHTIDKYLSWDLSQVCQTPSSRLFPTSHRPEQAFPFLPRSGLAKGVFSTVLYGWRKETQLRGKIRVSLTLSRVQSHERALLSEAAEKGLPVPNLTACSISCYSQSHWIGLTGPADHSVLGSIQNAPDTSAKHYKEPCW